MSFVDTTQLWRLLRVAAIVLVTGACSGSETATDLPTIRFADSGDAVTGAQVTPLVGNALTLAAPNPNVASTTTTDDGEFEFEVAPELNNAPNEIGVQVTVDVPSPTSPAVGRIDYRSDYDPASAQGLEIPEPTFCEGLVDCGTPLLPDLQPIIGWNDLDPEVVERLLPSTEGPPAAGLLPEETWFVEETDGQRLLRFATVAANIGDGPLDIIAAPDDGDNAPTWQRIWTDEFHFDDVPSGEFIFHDDHDHIHFDAFERYRLLDAEGTVIASSEKVSFCLRDSVLVVPEREGFQAQFDDGDCEGQQQIINAGFGDHYHALLEDQWIDITGVEAGEYTVEITVDPLDNIIEIDETNNTGTFPVVIE